MPNQDTEDLKTVFRCAIWALFLACIVAMIYKSSGQLIDGWEAFVASLQVAIENSPIPGWKVLLSGFVHVWVVMVYWSLWVQMDARQNRLCMLLKKIRFVTATVSISLLGLFAFQHGVSLDGTLTLVFSLGIVPHLVGVWRESVDPRLMYRD